MSENYFTAIQDVLQNHGQEPLLAHNIFDYAYAPDETMARVKQVLEEEGYEVKEISETGNNLYSVEMADGEEYDVFDENEKDEVIRYHLDNMDDMMPELFKNFLDERLNNMPGYLNPLDKMERCLTIFSNYLTDLHEHYSTVDWMRDDVYNRDFYICRKW